MLYSPVPSPIDKIKNKYRWRIIIKCKFDNTIINLVNQTLEAFLNIKKSESARIIADLNPNNMLWPTGTVHLGKKINTWRNLYKKLKNTKKGCNKYGNKGC